MADVVALSYKNPATSTSNGGVARFRDRRAAMTNGDVLVFGLLYAGMVIYDWFMANTASSGSTTMSIGFRNADGSATSPDDAHASIAIPSATFFLAATSIAAAARTRAAAPGTVANFLGFPLRLNKDIVVIGTLGGASIATDTLIELCFSHDFIGAK